MSTDPLGNLFARLRGNADEPVDEDAEPHVDEAIRQPDARRDPAPGSPVVRAPDDDAFTAALVEMFELDPVPPEPKWPVFGAIAESASLDDAALRWRREAAVGPAVAAVAPRVKRRVQDEQNELLDTLRRQKSRVDIAAALPDPVEQLRAWTDVVTGSVDEVYAAGRVLGGGRKRSAPTPFVQRLAEFFIAPLRDRVVTSLEAVIAEGPYEGAVELQRELSAAVSARYREWRLQQLEPVLGDLLTFAFARGIFDATPDGTRLRWVPAEVRQCPDADDNALEPTVKGRPFPTGQSCPPAHAGCRCLVVPKVDT
jgi:hypothetical protein